MNKLMKKTAAAVTTITLAFTLGMPAFAAGTDALTIQELQKDPNVSFMDNDSITKTDAGARSSNYVSTILVGPNGSVYGQQRYFDGGIFGSRVYNIDVRELYASSEPLTVSLCKVSFGAYNKLQSNSQRVSSGTKNLTYNFKYYDSGNYAFQYTASGTLQLSADVAMYSNSYEG